ncbi:hypothetical protein [Paenibacillus amylolyticus]|uniref:Uncharacterized protein n=1 Tax=Paenibacillus amylolyticus TaxID=1451 RepID=A0ABD8B2R2_PAEAM
MNKKEWKAIEEFADGKDLDVQVLRVLVRDILYEFLKLQEQLNDEQQRSTKFFKDSEHVKNMLLQHMNEISDLRNEKIHLEKVIQKQTIGAREQRLINVAKSLLAELEVKEKINDL